jgi:hypothetical protein
VEVAGVCGALVRLVLLVPLAGCVIMTVIMAATAIR